MKFQTLRDAMRAAEIARAELENAMVRFETAMAEMNKALNDATRDRANLKLVVSQ
jgi:outer membrane protein TolC